VGIRNEQFDRIEVISAPRDRRRRGDSDPRSSAPFSACPSHSPLSFIMIGGSLWAMLDLQQRMSM
jgi:hypothetical protein